MGQKINMMTNTKDLTFRYSVHQFFYWAGIGGVVSFAATYLTAKGFSAANVGWILFSAYVLSFIFQPFLASRVDRSERNIISGMLLSLTAVSCLCFCSVQVFKLPMAVFFVIYALGVMCLDMCVPLLNSIAMYYTRRGWKLNYGLGRGVGGFGFAVATLVFGYVIEDLGVDALLCCAIGCMIVTALAALWYPHDTAVNGVASGQSETVLSLPQFLGKYRWYCISLFGVLFLAMFHAMSENYMIEVLRPIGGDNSNVGMALFIATVTELPAMTVFPLIWKKLGSKRILLVSGICYTLKAVLFLLARSVSAIYAAQMLQCVTYVFLSTVQMYYADECTSVVDMVKGQSLITAFYTLGCAVGNLLGGNLISFFGVSVMLASGIAMTAAGFLILLFTVSRAIRTGKTNKSA